MRSRANRSASGGTRSLKLAAMVAGFLVLALAVPSWAVEPNKRSITAGLNMCMRAIAAQDPDPKTRNPDYLAEKIVNLEIMRDRLGWTLDFKPMVERFNQENLKMFYHLTARTKHIEVLLNKELKAGVKQVVLMGAGYDTRGYRFHKDFPKVKFFEVDLPVMSAFKQKRMKTKLPQMPNNVTYAPIDFNKQKLGEVLESVGWKKDQKTFFIWEGVVEYLEASAVESTLQFIAKNAAPGSSVVFDYCPPSVVDGSYKGDPYAASMTRFLASLGEPFTFGIDPDKSGAFLKKQGLKQESNVGHDYLVKNYMTGSNGKPFGTLPLFFWITQARVPGGK